jgi:hypothetical protein
MNLMKQGEDFDVVPGQDPNGDTWDFRILTGDFTETVIRFGNIKVDDVEEGGDGVLKYNYNVVSSPIPDLKEDNGDLQEVTAAILLSILESSVQNV